MTTYIDNLENNLNIADFIRPYVKKNFFMMDYKKEKDLIDSRCIMGESVVRLFEEKTLEEARRIFKLAYESVPQIQELKVASL